MSWEIRLYLTYGTMAVADRLLDRIFSQPVYYEMYEEGIL